MENWVMLDRLLVDFKEHEYELDEKFLEELLEDEQEDL
jgi:hypothetical protein